ncbi:hypothetical protein ScPMuIL_014717 [Solemya velum]
MDNRVHRITGSLHDTTRNLRSLDHMLGEYREVGRDQRSAIDRLRDDLDRTHEDIRAERARSPHRRDYDSDSEYEGSPARSRTRKRRPNTVRFADDMNKEIHMIHQSVRDLSSDHLGLDLQFSEEVQRRDRADNDTRRTMKEIKDTLKRLPQEDPTALKVEQRLAAIQNELFADRAALSRNEELSELSSELKHAISHQQQLSRDQDVARSHYLQAESQKYKIESELESMKRKLDQSEGSRTALQQQIEELRSQIHRYDQERTRLLHQMDENRFEENVMEKKKMKAVEAEWGREKEKMEKELQELRGQLTRSLGTASEAEELRRGVERSERQRAQLSDHIETLTKDLENREKQTAKLITQLKEVSDKLDDTERQRNHFGVQLEDSVQKLRESNRELERTSKELQSSQQGQQEAERRKEEFRSKAQDTVRQWKLKVKQLERDLDRQKHGADQMIHRNEQLVKEHESVRQQSHSYAIQMESFKRELSESLAIRAAQDEQLRIKDIELNELKSNRMDLEVQAKDSRTVAEKLEVELHHTQARTAGLTEERNKLEDKLSSIEASYLLAQDQARQMQQELNEVSTQKAELAAQLSEVTSKSHDIQDKAVEYHHREKAAREECKLYELKLREEREKMHGVVETLKREVTEIKVREAHAVQDMKRGRKRDQVEYEAAVQALKIELSEDKSAMKIIKRNEDKYHKEVERLQQVLQRTEEENAHLLLKLNQTRQEFESKTQVVESDMTRVKKLEDELYATQKDLKKAQTQHENLVQDMTAEVDAVLEIAASSSLVKQQTVSAIKGVPEGAAKAVKEIRSKLQWLRRELREKVKVEQKLKKELHEALSCNENDRQFLMKELAKREDVLDDISADVPAYDR